MVGNILATNLQLLCSLQVLAYILVMNSTTLLQNSHSSLLRHFGSFPLWLLVSHHHILLALNGQGLLFFFPNEYYLNMLSVIIVYLFVYQVVGKSTKTLKECMFSKTSPPTVSEPWFLVLQLCRLAIFCWYYVYTDWMIIAIFWTHSFLHEYSDFHAPHYWVKGGIPFH